jgi:hypothetical protein
MVEFRLNEVLAGWEIVSMGGTDHITYELIADGKAVWSRYHFLGTFLYLYECALKEMETENHPSGGSFYDIEKIGDDTIRFSVNRTDIEVTTTFDELEDALRTFLRQVFDRLDEKPDTDSKRAKGLQRLHGPNLIEHPEFYYNRITDGE